MNSSLRKTLTTLAVLAIGAGSAAAIADDGHGRSGFSPIAGTYVADATLLTIADFDCQFLVDVGAIDIDCNGPIYMTLHAGGTVTATDGSDFGEDRSPAALGVWSRDRGPGRSVTIRTYSPVYDTEGEQVAVTIREINATFDRQTGTFTGTFESNSFNEPKDPLDPAAVPDLTVTGDVSGRRFR